METILIVLAVCFIIGVYICLYLTNKTSSIRQYKQSEKIEEIIQKLTELEQQLQKCEQSLELLSSSQTHAKCVSSIDKQSMPLETRKSSKKEKHLGKKIFSEEQFTTNEISDFIDLAVLDGQLAEPSSGQTTYYRAWYSQNQLRYMFYSEKAAKAVNNYNAIIEPFCVLTKESRLSGNTHNIETISAGILNNDYTINKKAIIKLT